MKMNLKCATKPLLLLCLLLVSMLAKADEKTPKLFLDLKDGTTMTFELSERPKVTFPGNTLAVTTADFSYNDSISIADVRTMRFYEDATLSDITSLPKAAYSIRFTDGQTVHLKGFAEDAKIQVLSVSGASQQADCTVGSDEITLRLGHLPKGVYIIKVNDKSYKVRTK